MRSLAALVRGSRTSGEFGSQPPVDIGEAAAEAEWLVNPYEFVDNHAAVLIRSMDAWQKIAVKANELRDPESIQYFRDGLKEIYAFAGVEPDAELLDAHAQKVGGDFVVYTLLNARLLSQQSKIMPTNALSVKDCITSNGDSNVDFLIVRQRVGGAKFAMRIVSLAHSMHEADGYGRAVLQELGAAYAARPEALQALAQLYEDGIALDNELFRELRAMITLDWHKTDASQSVLKDFCAGLRTDPRVFIEGFSEQVEAAGQDRRLLQAKRMAEFAVSASSEGEVSPSISEILQRTYDEWHNFSEIQTPFDTYVTARVMEIERALGAIAGPLTKRNIRAHRSPQTVSEYRRTLEIMIGDYRKPAASPDSQRGGKRRPGKSLPSADDIKESSEKTKTAPPRQLMVVRAVLEKQQKKWQHQEISRDELRKVFGLKDSPELETDVKAMVAYLQKNPINRASKVLVDVDPVFIDGKVIKLRRFAPDKCSGSELSVHGDNRFYRVVYGYTRDALFVKDICDHDTFNKRYTS